MSRSYYVRSRTFDYPLRVPEVVRWWDAPNMKLTDGAFITEWYDRIAKDQAISASSLQKWVAGVAGGRAAVYWPTANGSTDDETTRFRCGYGNVHSNTDGMMVFIAAKWADSTRMIVCKSGVAGNTYFWNLHAQTEAVYEAKASASPGALTWNNDSPREWLVNTWGIVALTWTPGAVPEMYLNKTLCDYEGGTPTAVTSIEDDDGNDMKITIGGAELTGGGPFKGHIGDVIIVAKHTAALRNSFFDWLGARWTVTMP